MKINLKISSFILWKIKSICTHTGTFTKAQNFFKNRKFSLLEWTVVSIFSAIIKKTKNVVQNKNIILLYRLKPDFQNFEQKISYLPKKAILFGRLLADFRTYCSIFFEIWDLWKKIFFSVLEIFFSLGNSKGFLWHLTHQILEQFGKKNTSFNTLRLLCYR